MRMSRTSLYLLSAMLGAMLPPAVVPAAPPAAPTDLTAEPVAQSCIRLRWSDNSDDETGFRIEMRVTGSWGPIGHVPADNAEFESGGMLGGTGREYRHRVRAENADGASAWIEVGPTGTPDTQAKPRGRVLVEASKRFPRNGEGSFIQLESGELIYYYGAWPTTSDAARETCLAKVVSRDGGRTWSEPTIELKQSGEDLYHPCIVRTANGWLGMAYTRRHSGTKLAEKVYRYSRDQGKTWSEEVPISDGGWKYYITGAHDRLVRLASGRLIIPTFLAQLKSAVVIDGKGVAAALVYASDDDGRTWQRKTPEPLYIHEGDGPPDCEEPGIVECAPGKLLMVHRTLRGWLYESRSDDNGQTWSLPIRSSIRNPRAPARLERIPRSDAILMVHNSHANVHVESWHKGVRRILALRISRDGGRSWHGYRELEYQQDDVWYDYPNVYWADDRLHVAYRAIPRGGTGWRRVDVLYQRLDRDSILNKPASSEPPPQSRSTEQQAP